MSDPLFRSVAPGYFIAHNAVVTADVQIGADSSLWFGSVVRGDVAKITIGARTNVQDGAVVHCDTDVPNVIEDDVTIGHRAIVHGQFVGRGTLIGMGSILLSRTKIGAGCLVAAGAVVAPDTVVPDGMLILGVPGKIVRPVNDKEKEYMRWLSGHYVELAKKYVTGKIQ
jgi:carbonic anhydrase/acetyltransferase-like protein (isoleucine patch superfamily)